MSDDTGRTESAGEVSVAWLTDVGPRDDNQDRAVARLHDDGAWLIGVADGLGGHPRGAEAAQAAISGLPPRIAGSGELYDAFRAAHHRVFELAPEQARHRFGLIDQCPATTLCVAAWTPAGGLLIGHAGDTLPVLLWRDDQSWRGRSLSSPHRSGGDWGYLAKYLGAPLSWPSRHERLGEPMDLLTEDEIDPPDASYAVVILSDGAWEAVVDTAYSRDARPSNTIGEKLASALNPDDREAHGIATRIMAAARTAGLDDNTSVAVAAVTPAVR